MSAKQKILVISGITGIGKSDLALKIAKLLKTDIIVGDSLQIYKNFPIASNFPQLNHQKSSPKYHLLGEFDVLKERISAFKYKEILTSKIKEIINEGKIPLIEGGSGFYLNYFMSSGDAKIEYSELIKAGKTAREIIEKKFNKDWKQCEEYLISLCPTASNFVPFNDYYRLEKALKYAIISNGDFFKARDESKNPKIKEIYDFRGIFLTKNALDIYSDIHKRCDLMVESGYIEEVLSFIDTLDSSNMRRGYKEAEEFIKQVRGIGRIKIGSELKTYKLLKSFLLEFSSKFQTKTRQYAHDQMKYGRKNFNNFLWINHAQGSDVSIQQINEAFTKPREDFERLLSSKENKELIETYNDHKKTKFLKATPLQNNYDKVFISLCSGLFQKLGINFSSENSFIKKD